MTDQRGGPLSTYLPTPAPIGPGVPKPIERPTMSQMWQAGTDLSRADLPSAERDRLYDAYQPVLDELNQGRSWFRRYHNPGAGGANFETYLFDEGGNPVTSAPSRDVQEQHLWAAIDAKRANNPNAFPGLPKTQDEFHAKVLSDAKARIGAAKDTISRNDSWAGAGAQIGAGVVTSFRDPINIAAMPLGGTGRTLATQILTAGLANMAVEAVEQPFVAQQREKLGEELTIREAATNVAAAGLFGAGLHAAGTVAAPAIGGAIARGRGLAAAARERIGWANMTPPERIATLSLEREADVAATSPFPPGPGTDAHVARVDATVQGLRDGNLPAALPPAPPRFNAQAYSNAVGVAESGGRWNIGSSSSSAYGMYQITKGTWLRYAKTALGGLEGEAAWGRRTNPAAQEAVFNAITRDNRAALQRAGVPETNGNLYMLHFAGSGAGTKILKAAPDTAIERLLSEKAIAANPFLKGKTAGEVVSWAHAKMGDQVHEGPVLSRAGFDEHEAGDAEWRAAQDEVDAAERQMAEARRADVDEATPRVDVDDDIPFDLDDPRRTRAGSDRDPFEDLPDEMRDAAPARIDDDPFDASPEPVAEPAPRQQLQPTVSKAIANDLEERGLGPRATLTALPERGPPGISIVNEEGHFATAVFRDADGVAQGVVRMPISAEAHAINREVSSYVNPQQRRLGIATRLYDALEDAGIGVDRLSGAAELTPDGAAFVNARRARDPAARAARAGGADGARPTIIDPVDDRLAVQSPPAAGFDHPDDIAAARQMDSLEHDLRMFLAEDEAKGLTVKLDENGDAISAADALEALDVDEAAITAARACMVPGGAA